MSARRPHYPVPSEERTRAMVEEVLHGSDRVVALHPVTQVEDFRRTVPKRLLTQPSVFPPLPKAQPRKMPWWEYPLAAYMTVTDYAAYPFEWVGYKIADGIRWLFRPPKRRYRIKHLKGSWGSIAGGLVSKTRPVDHQVLVVGDRLLALLYVGPERAELAWSVPREQLTGVERTDWDRFPGQPRSTARFHFADSSWGDLCWRNPGNPEWKHFLNHLPAH